VGLLELVDADNEPVYPLIVNLTDSWSSARKQSDVATQKDLLSESLGRLLVHIEFFRLVSPVDRLDIVLFTLCLEDCDDDIGSRISAANYQRLDADIFGRIINVLGDLLPLEIAFRSDDSQPVALVTDILKSNFCLDIHVFVLDKMLYVLEITFDGNRFVGWTKFIDQEGFRSIFGLRRVDKFPL